MSSMTLDRAPIGDQPPSAGLLAGDPAAIERWLLAWLERALGAAPGQIDRALPFRKMGVRSLQIVELMAEVEDTLLIEVEAADLMEFPTVATLASYLAELSGPGAGS